MFYTFQQFEMSLEAIQPPSDGTQFLNHFSLAQVHTSSQLPTLEFLSGTQFFVALVAGIAMAFAFQFVLSNLTIAVGISGEINPVETDAEGWGSKIRRIEAKVGGTTLFIVNTALFVACFLAIKLTLIQNMGLAAIVAVVIWSIYFLLLLWVSSRAVGSVAGAVGNTASSGVQGVMALVSTALGGGGASKQITNTVEASAKTISSELQSVLSSELASDRLRENLQDYVLSLQLPKPNLGQNLDNGPNQALELLSQTNVLPGNSSELFNLIKTATPEDLESGKLRERLTELLGLSQGNGNGHENERSQDDGQSSGGEQSRSSGVGLQQRALQMGTSALVTTLLEQSGFSGQNLESLKKTLSSLGQQGGEQAKEAVNQTSSPAEVIRSDIETYLLDSPSWYLRPESLDRGFREVLLDPEADASLVLPQLTRLDRRYFVEVLNRREGIASEQINDIADELELIRREVLDQVREAEAQERSQQLRHQVETYLQSAPKEALNAEQIQQEFTALLADPGASYESLGNRLIQFDRDTLTQMLLAGRQDLSQEETEQILNELEGSRDRFLNQSRESWEQLQSQSQEFRQQVESYFRETNLTELTPDAIRQTFQMLLEAPGGGLLALRSGLNQIDRPTLEQILSQRDDIDSEQVDQLIDQIESVRDGILHGSQELTEQAKEQADRLTQQIGEYLNNTNLDELNPENLQQDLRQLLRDSGANLSELGSQLKHLDRETLVNLLSQQDGFSEEQINQAIDQVQDAFSQIIRTPKRVADRTQERVQDLQTELENYLRHTNREELNPEGIQQDLQRLFKQPRAGAEQLLDRFSQVDRNTLIALLTQREDISEENAHQIVEQIESIGDRLVQQAQSAKDQIQDTAQSVSDQTRKYRDALESSYKDIQHDVRKLFDDPEAELSALRDRLSQFDRETLVDLLSSRTDLSEEQVNQVIDQIEAARDSALQRAERIQTKVEAQLKQLKHQAKEQAEEVQKTVASAAWWLFGTALTSVATATIAGILAAGGFNFWN
ncbi:MFS transporter [Egbenema bharatensis]|uniref:MFS transporter n=1 Tax=Egbenema bharatensis TaxID=3463334 RepID=UPI003A874D08